MLGLSRLGTYIRGAVSKINRWYLYHLGAHLGRSLPAGTRAQCNTDIERLLAQHAPLREHVAMPETQSLRLGGFRARRGSNGNFTLLPHGELGNQPSSSRLSRCTALPHFAHRTALCERPNSNLKKRTPQGCKSKPRGNEDQLKSANRPFASCVLKRNGRWFGRVCRAANLFGYFLLPWRCLVRQMHELLCC